jgi:hypothetical protein
MCRRIQEKARLAKESIRKERKRLNMLNTFYIFLTVIFMLCLALLVVALKVGDLLLQRYFTSKG